MDKSLSPDARADLLVKAMTLDEKIQLVNGGRSGPALPPNAPPTRSLGGAGYIVGIERLGIPDLQLADSSSGVTRSGRAGRYATALPSDIGLAASWNTELASSYGELIGRELRDQGYNGSLAGGVDLAREPRGGRNAEYMGEDPILAGTMVGNLMKGMQSVHVMTDLKHYAVNDQETGRYIVNAQLSERALRESDLLAFEIGFHIAHPSATMCSYNKVNGDWSCENKYLLTDVLKNDWGFKGWVMSDWGATHSTEKAALAGLDQEEPSSSYFGEKLKQAVVAGAVPEIRLDDMVHRILRSMIKSGVFDDPPQPQVPDPFAGYDLARKVEEQSIVLLKNQGALLPLNASKVTHILVVGAHADVGVLDGGGVDAPGGNAVPPAEIAAAGGAAVGAGRARVWLRSSPLKYLKEQLPQAQVEFDPGTDLSEAAQKAAKADVVIVFAIQPIGEGGDGDMKLPNNQDALIDVVASANKNTVVVIENGASFMMPWADKVPAIVASWFPGIAGGQAIAEMLTGAVNPSGKLPITFARSTADLPQPKIFGSELTPRPAAPGERGPVYPAFDAPYAEGLMVGYKWFDAKQKQPLFAFGHGLSYTTYRYSNARATQENGIQVTFTVKNIGQRTGAEISEVYLAMPAGIDEPPKRLVGWSRNELRSGEEKTVTVSIDPHYCAIFNAEKHSWEIVAGEYQLLIGGSSTDLPIKQAIHLEEALLPSLSAE
jgi:beta-glucosidase